MGRDQIGAWLTLKTLLSRLLLIVSVALVPALGFQAYTESQARHIRQQLVEDEALRLLHLVNAEQQRIAEGAEQVLNTLAGAPAIQDNRPEFCQRLLTNLLQQSPRYTFAGTIGLDGHLICTPGPVNRDLDFSDRAYFRLARQTGGFVIGEYATGRYSGQPTIHMAKPFRDSKGKIAGVVVVGLSLNWLGQQLDGLDLPPGAIVSVADRNGTFLAHRPDGARFVGQPLPAEDRFLLDGNQIGIFRMQSLHQGRPIILAYLPPGAETKGVGVGVGLDREITFAAVTQANVTGLLLIIAGGGLALAVTALLGTGLIRRPLDQLLRAADRWRTGDLATRTGFHETRSEFGRMAAAFDAMAAALEAREHTLRTALESTTDSVMMFDRSWRITYLSERAKAHIAQGRDLVGQIIWDALPGTSDSVFAAGYRLAMESGQPTHTVGFSPAFQTYFEAHAYPSGDNLTVFFRDVTEERRVAVALRESEARLRVAVEAAGLGVFDVDIVTGEANWSAEMFALLGIAPTPDGRAHTTLWRDCVHPDDRAATNAARQRSVAEGVPYHAAYRIRRASDGVERWMEGYARLNGPPEQATHLIGVMFDITERKRAEAMLRDANAELEHRVAERTRALTEAGRELQAEMRRREETQASVLQTQKLEALGQLTGGVAHDFNNVLAAILGSFDLLSARITDERLRRFVDLGERAARRAEALVRQLLAFARREQLTPVTIEPASLLQENAPLIRHTAGPRVSYVLEVAPGTWPILADVHQLEVALLNLTSNARDAMADGGQLTITTRNVHTTATNGDEPCPPSLPPGDYVVLSVHDTGTGMPAEVLTRATDPFFTTKEAGRGTGLGLAMVHGFAVQSGGALRIHSTPGEGTQVEIWLPRAAARTDQPDGAEVTTDPALHGDATLLVVDDDNQVRPVTAGYLRDLGYSVIEAANAEAAEVLAHAAGSLDLVITDVVMPGADGPALAARLRAEWPGLPVLFVTGHADRTRLEGEAVLAKPFTSAELGRRVLECLGRGSSGTGEALLAARLRTPKLREAYQAWRRARKPGGRLPTPAEFDLSARSFAADAFLVAVSATPEGHEFHFIIVGPALNGRLGQTLDGTSPAADDALGSLEDGYRRCVRTGLPTYEYARFRLGDAAPVLFERLLLPLSEDGSTLTHLAGVALFANIPA